MPGSQWTWIRRQILGAINLQYASALVGSRDDVVFLDFDREGVFFGEFVLTAIANVESAGIGARVARIEPDELATMAEIARRSQRSRESMRRLLTGQRGPSNFPPRIANLSPESPIWRWYEVGRWLEGLSSSRLRWRVLCDQGVAAQRWRGVRGRHA